MKKLLTLILALVLVVSLCGFTTIDGIGSVYQTFSRNIAPSSIFTHIAGTNVSSGGNVNVFTVEIGTSGSNVKPYVYCGQVRETKALSAMTSAIANEGWKVIGGINGDIYDMSTGTPKGAVIHNGELITGGYQTEYLLSFDKLGKAQLSKPSISYSLEFQRQVPKSEGEGSTIMNVTGKASYFNVPHGGANALHLYNYRYASNTKTTGTCAEVVLTIKNTSTAALHIGDTITAEVTSVNPNTKSTTIADNQLVLSCNNKSDYYTPLCQMVVGTDVTLKVSADNSDAINSATEALGVYNMMALDGQVLTTDKTLNPRTAIGLKEDGTVVLFVADGRNEKISKGMNAVDITNYLMSQGCTSVVNMDGGASTTMTARYEPGITNEAKLVNNPSGGTERKVTNGLFFVYTGDGGAASEIEVYPVSTAVLPGMSVQLSSYGVNSYYEKSELTEPLTYSVDSAWGSVDDKGIFTAGQTEGSAEITAYSGGLTGKLNIDIVKDISFTLNKTSLQCKPGETCDFNISSVNYGPVSVLYKDELFTWSCPSELGTISKTGVFTANSKNADASGNITVSYGSKQVSIPVKIVSTLSFPDIANHWAKDYITKLVDLKILNGMGDGTFGPDESLTRAQFLTMLSKIDSNENLNVTASKKFSDVKSDEWYYKVVNWGVKNNVVNGYENGTFCPDNKVTREQMCVMLYNYYIYKGKTWTGADKELTFKDKSKISQFALIAVKKVVNQGIMSGRPEGDFDPLGCATRGEAAKIISMIL